MCVFALSGSQSHCRIEIRRCIFIRALASIFAAPLLPSSIVAVYFIIERYHHRILVMLELINDDLCFTTGLTRINLSHSRWVGEGHVFLVRSHLLPK